MFKITETLLSGCFILNPNISRDFRGSFTKTYNTIAYEQHNLSFDFQEQYYSVSKQNVIRGLHFQIPPADHIKIVYCTSGSVLDIVVDIRKGSPTYGRHIKINLNSDNNAIVYIPAGLAHGFAVLSNEATMVYNLSSVYAPECDMGIMWNSVGIDWPITEPIISERDQKFTSLQEFESPFHYDKR